jgi:ArsR family transcriptional regulator
MYEPDAVAALAALAHETRLRVFRLLIERGPDGLAAGLIAESLGVHAATLSGHLAQLERAGLIASERRSRNVIYSADIEGAGALLSYLTDDCCRGRPDICRPILGGRPATGRSA